MGKSEVTGSYIAVALGHSDIRGTCECTEIFDLLRFLLSDLFDADNLASSFFELPQLTKKVPKPRFGDNTVRSEDSHSVKVNLCQKLFFLEKFFQARRKV